VNSETKGNRTAHALAGLQAGVVGSLFMLLWCLIAALWTRHSFWTIPNLYATGFYGSDAYVNGFTRGSWSGLALMIFICGALGAVWGLACGGERKPFLTLFGAVTGLLVYYLLFGFVLRYASPLIPLYAPEAQIRIGYLVWGLALSRSPLYAQQIAAALGPRS
jgi:hypothetical protein